MTEELAKLETHNLMLEDRKRLRLTGVTDVDSFDEGAITAYTVRGELVIGGSELRVLSLDTDSGELRVEGTITSLTYLENAPTKGSVLSRLLR